MLMVGFKENSGEEILVSAVLWFGVPVMFCLSGVVVVVGLLV